MKEILVMGIGSRIMMDDGIGIYLVEDLQKQIKNIYVKFIIGETDIDYCICKISKEKRIVVIDAFMSGSPPGEVSVVPLDNLDRGHDNGYSLHGLHFLNVLQRAENESEGILIGVEPYEINYGFYLSDMLTSRYSDIYKSVFEIVNKYVEDMEG